MRIKETLSSRERVKLALEHKETDRVPISMICSGFNPPIHAAFNDYLEKEHKTDLNTYISSILDAGEFRHTEGYKPKLSTGVDIWGVKRKPVSYGSGSYDEIAFYPLANAKTPDDIKKHPWPSTGQFDYSTYPGSIEKLKSGRDIYIILSNAKDMDPIALKSQYGDRLCFEGGICVQKILPFGTEEEVIDETKKLIDVLSKNGGYILGPSHCIQAGTPPENIHSMFETALSYKKVEINS